MNDETTTDTVTAEAAHFKPRHEGPDLPLAPLVEACLAVSATSTPLTAGES